MQHQAHELLGQYKLARSTMRRVHAILERQHGRQHPNVLHAMSEIKRLNVLTVQDMVVPGPRGPNLRHKLSVNKSKCASCGITVITRDNTAIAMHNSTGSTCCSDPRTAAALPSICHGCADTKVALKLSLPRLRSRTRRICLPIWRNDLMAAQELSPYRA